MKRTKEEEKQFEILKEMMDKLPPICFVCKKEIAYDENKMCGDCKNAFEIYDEI